MIRWIIREFRSIGYRLWIILFSIALGIGAITAVQGLADSIREGISEQSRPLQAGDVVARSMHPFPDEYIALGKDFMQSETKEMFTMARSEQGESLLAELKAVSDQYPLYGEISLSQSETLQERLNEKTVIVEQTLLQRLSLAIDDPLFINGVQFQIADIVLSEPDRLNVGMSSGPRVFLSSEGLERSKLEQFGSRITRKLQWKVSIEQKEALLEELNALGTQHAHIRIQAGGQGTPSTQRSINNTERFLSLIALFSLLIGMIGVVQTLRSWLEQRQSSIAVFRCLGLSNRELYTLYLSVVVVLAFLGSTLGLGLASVGMQVLLTLASEYLPINLHPRLSLQTISENLLLGILVSVISCYPIVYHILKAPPIMALRTGISLPPARRSTQLLSGCLYIVLTWGTFYWQAKSIPIALGATLTIISVIGLVYLFSILLRKALSSLRLSDWKYRHALENFRRPERKTNQAMIALAMGMLVVTTIALLEKAIQTQFASIALSKAPSHFFVDIQPDQWSSVSTLLDEQEASSVQSAPVVMARLSKINDRPVSELIADKPETEHWAFTREQRLSYGQSIPKETVLEGEFLSLDEPNELCLEFRYAERLGISVGDRVTFDVQGIPLEFIITATRRIQWESLQMNFFLVGEEALLSQAPQFRLATAQLPLEKEEEFRSNLVKEFPNISIISTREITQKVFSMIENLSIAVQTLGAFSIAVGLLILLGSVQSTLAQREQQNRLFHTIGATRKEISKMVLIEFSLLGLCAAIVGASIAWVLCWSCLHYLFRLSSYPSLLLSLFWIGFGTALTAIFTQLLLRWKRSSGTLYKR